MKKTLALFLSLLLTLSLAACGAVSSDSLMGATTSSSDTYNWEEIGVSASEEASLYSSDSWEDAAETTYSLYEDSNVKLIRSASLYMEATDLDQACSAFEALVAALNGYLEYSDVYQGGYDDNAYRYASYTARVPSSAYDSFLSSLSDESVCHLVNKSESTQNVGQQYADIEAHLEMLNIKLERLNQLLSQAEDMEDIITLESAISDTEYEIASYTSSRSSYDNLIDYATFTITIDEVRTLTPVATPSFGSQVKTALVEGFQRFGSGVQSLVLFLTGALPVLLVLAVVAAAVLLVVRRSRKKKKEHRQVPPPPQP